MHLDVSSVGNHEFDEGVTELLRMQNGGCHPVDGCYFPTKPLRRRRLPVAGRQRGDEATGSRRCRRTRSSASRRQGRLHRHDPGGHPTLVAAAGIAGLTSSTRPRPPTCSSRCSRPQGVKAIVVLLHEGGRSPPPGDVKACVGISGPIVDIKPDDPAIDALVTGHTHQPYNCLWTIPPASPPRHQRLLLRPPVHRAGPEVRPADPRRAPRPEHSHQPHRRAGLPDA